MHTAALIAIGLLFGLMAGILWALTREDEK
jgi:hypothetical protein